MTLGGFIVVFIHFFPVFLSAFSTRSFLALEKAGKRAAESSGTFILALFSWGRCIKMDFGCEEDTLFIITVEGIMNALFDRPFWFKTSGRGEFLLSCLSFWTTCLYFILP